MVEFIEYDLGDDMTVLVKAPGYVEQGGGESEFVLTKKEAGPKAVRAEKSFQDSLESVRRVGHSVRDKLKDLHADEVELSFGLVTTGKLGNFAIAEIGVEANFEVTLKWKNQPVSEGA